MIPRLILTMISLGIGAQMVVCADGFRYKVIFYVFGALHWLFAGAVAGNYLMLNPPSMSAMLEQIFFLDYEEMLRYGVLVFAF